MERATRFEGASFLAGKRAEKVRPCAVSYFLAILTPTLRDKWTWGRSAKWGSGAEILDQLAAGKGSTAADIAAQRLKALEQSVQDGNNWRKAKFLELVTDDVGMTDKGEEQMMVKEVELEERFRGRAIPESFGRDRSRPRGKEGKGTGKSKGKDKGKWKTPAQEAAEKKTWKKPARGAGQNRRSHPSARPESWRWRRSLRWSQKWERMCPALRQIRRAGDQLPSSLGRGDQSGAAWNAYAGSGGELASPLGKFRQPSVHTLWPKAGPLPATFCRSQWKRLRSAGNGVPPPVTGCAIFAWSSIINFARFSSSKYMRQCRRVEREAVAHPGDAPGHQPSSGWSARIPRSQVGMKSRKS